jgi:hypothetical protein
VIFQSQPICPRGNRPGKALAIAAIRYPQSGWVPRVKKEERGELPRPESRWSRPEVTPVDKKGAYGRHLALRSCAGLDSEGAIRA